MPQDGPVPRSIAPNVALRSPRFCLTQPNRSVLCCGGAPEFIEHLRPTGGPNKSQQRPTLHTQPNRFGECLGCVGSVALIQRHRVRRSRDRPCPAVRHARLKTDLFRGLLHATSRYDRRDFALHSRPGPSCAAAVLPNSSNICIPPAARTNLNSDRPYTHSRTGPGSAAVLRMKQAHSASVLPQLSPSRPRQTM